MFLEMNTLQLGPYWQEVQVPMHIRGEITLLRELGGTGIQRTCVYVCRGEVFGVCVYVCVCVHFVFKYLCYQSYWVRL